MSGAPPSAAQTPPDSEISSAESLSYWNSIPSSVSGMLGGFPQVSTPDLKGSYNFACNLRPRAKSRARDQGKEQYRYNRAVDCGAGIGRVTEGLLARIAEKVDVVEPVDKFAQVVRDGRLKKEGRVGKVFVCGLEDWVPQGSYDLIWNQWCLGHLKDVQLVAYLKRCADAVAEDGWIVVKENLSTDEMGGDMYDDVDSSVTRTQKKLEWVFAESGLEVVKREQQKGFEKGLGLMPVMMFALRPATGREEKVRH